ncbi:MAG: hypothetical protein LBI56_04375, partial [Puniceicoccales bacterium]|nr:hypothetical protein [Puniceicoccales bacterium]
MTNYVKSIFSYFGSFFGKNCNPPEKSDGINESLANAQPTNISSSSSSSSSRVPNRGLNNYSISS